MKSSTIIESSGPNKMSESIAIVAGAGVAAAAGLPALHGINGTALQDSEYSRVLNPTDYGNFLPEFWDFAKKEALKAVEIEPQPLHLYLAEKGWPIVTQNIGGICIRAGSKDVIEVYGSLFKGRCLRCQHELDITIDDYNNLDKMSVPCCPKCGKCRTRPTISLPGEKEQQKRKTEHILNKVNKVIYLGIDKNTGPITEWHTKVPHSILISPKNWGSFNTWFEMTPQQWFEAGCPLYKTASQHKN